MEFWIAPPRLGARPAAPGSTPCRAWEHALRAWERRENRREGGGAAQKTVAFFGKDG